MVNSTNGTSSYEKVDTAATASGSTEIKGIDSCSNNGGNGSSTMLPSWLSSKWLSFDSIKEQFNDMVDEQRLERLQHCRMIEDVYTECRRYSKMMKLLSQQQQYQQQQQQQQNNRPSHHEEHHLQEQQQQPPQPQEQQRAVQLEDITPGIRILKYYDWRHIHEYDHKCSREQHSIWACRAGALQCGAELVQLRNCFNALQMPKYIYDSNPAAAAAAASTSTSDGSTATTEPTPAVPGERNYGAILNTSITAYEPSKKLSNNSNSNSNIPCRELQEKMGYCIAKNATALSQREMDRTKKYSEQQEHV